MVRGTTVIGIDAAVSSRNVGVALGHFTQEDATIAEVLPADVQRVAERVSEEVDAGNRVLICIDAPLGWPRFLGATLSQHSAGEQVATDPNILFRRGTDRWIKANIGQQSLDVGADRIARTAVAALALLGQLRELTGEPIPLAWSSGSAGRATCIEVYPAATLRSRGLQHNKYKRTSVDSPATRARILDAMQPQVSETVRSAAISSDHVFDAALCVVAGLDFLGNECHPPVDLDEARREGWIWVRYPAAD